MRTLLALTLPLLFGAQEPEQPTSLLTRPLYLEAERPELRAMKNIVLLHADVSKDIIPHNTTRSLEETLQLASELATQIREGAEFTEVAKQHSASNSGKRGADLGSYPAGMLIPPLDEFLRSAELGEVSDPVETPFGVQILKRVPARAGVLHIRIRGEGAEAKIRELHERIMKGEDFGELAKEHSMDDNSKESGGEYAIFVRGTQDTQLKALVFSLEVGELSKPYETPLGWHLVKRVPPEDIAPELEERLFVKAHGVLVAWKGCIGASDKVTRDKARAQELILDMQQRLREGEYPMAFFGASQFNDDPGGRDREGNLGWVYRRNPDLPVFMSELFRVPPGTLLDLVETSAGYVLLQRDE